jgi:hypothetical protein
MAKHFISIILKRKYKYLIVIKSKFKKNFVYKILMDDFKNIDVFILSPINDKHQSNITIMFNSSGVGINVECMYGIMHVRASAPYSLFVSKIF